MLSNAVVPENGGTLFVGELSTQDPDKAQSFEYSLVSASEENVFYVSGRQLRTNASLDYEKRSSWDLMIETVDQGGKDNRSISLYLMEMATKIKFASYISMWRLFHGLAILCFLPSTM
jgi:hypothetical protein